MAGQTGRIFRKSPHQQKHSERTQPIGAVQARAVGQLGQLAEALAEGLEVGGLEDGRNDRRQSVGQDLLRLLGRGPS